MVLLEIVTPDGKFFSEEVKMVIVRGIMGDLAFMKNTAPIVTPIGIGKLKVKYEDDTEKVGTINEGYVSGLENKVTVVTDAFEWAEEIDIQRAFRAKERALQKLESKDDDIDVDRAKIALSKALNRLSASGKGGDN